ncbi:MAG: hypothetical protein WCJ64_11870 [Rhodospirillaceae bacterium]
MDNTQFPTDRPTVDITDVCRANDSSRIRFGLIFSVCLLIASTAPAGLVLATFNSLIYLFSILAGILAVIKGHRLFAPHLTCWDEAAALVLMTGITDFMIDRQEVQAALAAAAISQ